MRVRLRGLPAAPASTASRPSPGSRRSAGALAAALERTLRHTVELTCAGRTDAGVHAWGQVVTFDARADVDLVGRAAGASTGRCGRRSWSGRPSVAPPASTPGGRRPAAGTATPSLNRPVPDPFLGRHRLARARARSTWRPCGWPAIPCTASTTSRRSAAGRRRRTAHWCAGSATPTGPTWATGVLRFEIEASSFCQQMVRALVGTMVDIGVGKRTAGEMASILRARQRAAAGQLAPPHGLCLWEVSYPAAAGDDAGGAVSGTIGGDRRAAIDGDEA